MKKWITLSWNPQILKCLVPNKVLIVQLLLISVLVLSHSTYLKNSPCSLKQRINIKWPSTAISVSFDFNWNIFFSWRHFWLEDIQRRNIMELVLRQRTGPLSADVWILFNKTWGQEEGGLPRCSSTAARISIPDRFISQRKEVLQVS